MCATSMCIHLEFTDTGFRAEAAINIESANTREFSLLLNKSFHITDVLINGIPAEWVLGKDESIAWYFVPGRRILIYHTENIKEICVKYTGEILEANMNTITRDIKAISDYSLWFPLKTSVKIDDDEVIVHGCEDYFVVKGVFDENEKLWKYGGRGYHKYNIICFKKSVLKTISSPYVNVYYTQDDFTEKAESSVRFYDEVADYFNGVLYDKKDLPVFDMVFLGPAVKKGGAYMQEELIVCQEIEHIDDLMPMIAHELAHHWCTGAPGNWEDWLNETTAEWSALIFALECGDTTLFEHMINTENRKETYKQFPTIKTPDGGRPDGVHHRGTMLFYEIYKRFGCETIKTILRSFVGLKDKNTANLLQALRVQSSWDVITFIERGLTSDDYQAV